MLPFKAVDIFKRAACFLFFIFLCFATCYIDLFFNRDYGTPICEFDEYSIEITKLCSKEYFNQFFVYTDMLYWSFKNNDLMSTQFDSFTLRSGWPVPNMFDFRYLGVHRDLAYLFVKHTIEFNCNRIHNLVLENLLGFNWENKFFFNGQSYIEGAEFYWVDRELTHPSVVKLYEMWEKIFITDVTCPFKPENGPSPYLIYDFADKQLYWDIHNALIDTTNYISFKKQIFDFFVINRDFIELNSNITSPNDFFLDLSAATVYFTSEPNFKYFIPYPFVASGNYVHHDYWWLHIAVYYYWLWFFFIFLIIFFFISFLWEIEHNNLKNLPQRETRGVSRSKCGDLITAIIPISWATAIIIHESTDAIDTFDGFGTLEFVVGIRAYQWGWEYYYPNSLKNNITNSNDKNLLIGNSNLFLINNNETITRENNNNILLNKNQNYNILPIFAITNSNINKEIFNINKMTNFGFSKLCIFNAYKFALNNKSVNYSNILNSTSNLTNFNSKKFISKYQINTFDTDSNITQSKITLLSTKLKLFKKFYNRNEIKLYKTLKLSDFKFNFNNKIFLNSLNFVNFNFNVYKFFLNPQISINNYKVLNFDYVSFKDTNTLLLKNFTSNSMTNISNSVLNNNFQYNYLFYFRKLFQNNNYMNLFNNKNIFLFKNINLNYVLEKKNNIIDIYSNCNFFKISYFGDLTFRRVDANEMLEDMYWDFYFDDLKQSNQINNSTNFFKFNQYIFKFYGNYEMDKELKINNLFYNTFWYKNYNNIKNNISVNSLLNTKFNYKELITLNKLNIFLENSFLNNKNYFINFNLNNTNLIIRNNFFINLISPNLILSYLSKYNPINLYSNSDYFLYNNSNIKLNTNFTSIDNLKILLSTVNSVWKTFKTNVYDNKFYFNKINLNFNFYDNFILTLKNDNLTNLINKNLTTFFETINFNKTHYKYLNSIFNKFFYLKNLTSFELPFSVSSESDSFKYNWIDWYVPYTKRESKFIDITQYNLNGSKLFFNKYDYYYNDVNELNILDNYYTRLLNNKKNYINSFNYTPFLLLKNNYNFNTYSLKNLINNFENIHSVLKFNLLLNYMKTFDKTTSIDLKKINNPLSFNNFFTDTKNFFFSLNDFNNYYSYISMINNILLKRNFLIKQLLFNNLNFNNLNNYNISIKNDIINEWKSTLINNNKNKIERNLNTYFIQNFLISSYDFNNFKTLLEKLTTNYLVDNYFYYSANMYINNLLKKYINNINLNSKINENIITGNNKSQYNHMKKSISNMLRLQPTKSISLPTDTKIQILAWSKDIIHSWAIPSAGIKIDCIPGYSSHKVFNITLSGIYYGQCMEICGRFHHWMPIVVYFLKKDLFLLWCLNVLYNKKINYLNNNKKLKNTTNSVFYK